MLFSNRIRCFVCSCIAFLGFGLNLNILKAIEDISYVVFYQEDYPMIWRSRCSVCEEKIKGECCFIPYKTKTDETDETVKYLFGSPLNQICFVCLKEYYLIPHLRLLKETSNGRVDYVKKAGTSIIEGSSKYMDRDPDHGRPSCYKCKKLIMLMEDDMMDISNGKHAHKICLESKPNTDGTIINSEGNFKLAASVVDIKALIDKVWLQLN